MLSMLLSIPILSRFLNLRSITPSVIDIPQLRMLPESILFSHTVAKYLRTSCVTTACK